MLGIIKEGMVKDHYRDEYVIKETPGQVKPNRTWEGGLSNRY